MTAVIAKYTLQEGKTEEFTQIVKQLVEATRKEEGCILYECCKSDDDPLKYMMMEKWASRECFDSHIKSAHFLELGPKMRAFLTDRTVEIFSEL
jgi:quinol monooxygenase YgiN